MTPSSDTYSVTQVVQALLVSLQPSIPAVITTTGHRRLIARQAIVLNESDNGSYRFLRDLSRRLAHEAFQRAGEVRWSA